MNWKEKTCEKCVFRDMMICRRFPPQTLTSISVDMVNSFYPRYPLVVQAGLADASKNGLYIDACAEYTEALNSGTP